MYTPSPIGKLELHDILLLSANAQKNITFSISVCVSVLVCLSGNVEAKPPEQTPKVEPNAITQLLATENRSCSTVCCGRKKENLKLLQFSASRLVQW
jgi:hypothetical protein